MTLATTDARVLRQASLPRAGRLVLIIVAAVTCLTYAMIWHRDPPAMWALTLGGSLGFLAVGLLVLEAARGLIARRAISMLAAFFENDAAPSFVTEADGALVSGNPAARLKFQPTYGDTLTATLRGTFADPSAILFRLQALADRKGSAREDIVTRAGPVRLTAQRLQHGRYFWRIESIPDPSQSRRGAEALPLPAMTVSQSGAILSMNDAARAMAGVPR